MFPEDFFYVSFLLQRLFLLSKCFLSSFNILQEFFFWKLELQFDETNRRKFKYFLKKHKEINEYLTFF